jgi:hypothetical protein
MKNDDPRLAELRNLHCDTHDHDLGLHVVTFDSKDVSVRWDACCDDLRTRAKAIVDRPPAGP